MFSENIIGTMKISGRQDKRHGRIYRAATVMVYFVKPTDIFVEKATSIKLGSRILGWIYQGHLCRWIYRITKPLGWVLLRAHLKRRIK